MINKKAVMYHNFLNDLDVVKAMYADDEQLVQALGNAIYQGFSIKAESEE